MKEYFQHDYHARTDENIIRLLRSHGLKGYGLYWALVEMIYEGGGSIPADYDLLAYELRAEAEPIKAVCETFNLFYVSQDNRIRSHTIDRRLEERAEKSAMATGKALKRWGKNAEAMPRQCHGMGIREEDKREENKREEESRGEYSAPFEQFWAAYPKKAGKEKAWEAWQEKTPDLNACLKTLKWQSLQEQWTREAGRFIPNPATWLQQGRWTDEPPAAGQSGDGAKPVPGKYDGIGVKV